MRDERFLNFSHAAVDVRGKRSRGCNSLAIVGLSVLSEIKILVEQNGARSKKRSLVSKMQMQRCLS